MTNILKINDSGTLRLNPFLVYYFLENTNKLHWNQHIARRSLKDKLEKVYGERFIEAMRMTTAEYAEGAGFGPNTNNEYNAVLSVDVLQH